MNSQIDQAHHFRALHQPGNPVVLYNIWDAGSAVAVARAGAKAVATSSWSLAAAQGLPDGQALPLDDTLANVARIMAAVSVPVTVDFEGGYASDPAEIGCNVTRLLDLGVAGLNFEDQVIGGPGLYSINDQVARLQAVRAAVDATGVPAFVNARTDVFLKAAADADPSELLEMAIARAVAYAQAGADGFFVPGLTDGAMIERICRTVSLPVNVMVTSDLTRFRELAALGVARVSFGPAPYIALSAALENQARGFY